MEHDGSLLAKAQIYSVLSEIGFMAQSTYLLEKIKVQRPAGSVLGCNEDLLSDKVETRSSEIRKSQGYSHSPCFLVSLHSISTLSSYSNSLEI